MTTAEAFAPAKVNLALHVTGQRDDGYHLLDSLVAFADVGDHLIVEAAAETTLTIYGPFAAGLSTDDNLILDAARLMGVTAKMTLEKNLPVAAGIGGGSADAAAALKALAKLSNRAMPDRAQQLSLGADVPVCVQGGLLRMQGVGEDIQVLANTPPSIPMILVNPRVQVSTPDVFAALASRENAPLQDPIPEWTEDTFLTWLSRQRNDLEAPARGVAPIIGSVLEALAATDGAAVVRMSGSGATCFALYPDERDAAQALAWLRDAHPDWWSQGSHL